MIKTVNTRKAKYGWKVTFENNKDKLKSAASFLKVSCSLPDTDVVYNCSCGKASVMVYTDNGSTYQYVNSLMEDYIDVI